MQHSLLTNLNKIHMRFSIGDFIVKLRWAHNTDLLAIVGKQRVCIVRLDGQKLWQVPLPPKCEIVEHLSWRTDGKLKNTIKHFS